MQRLQSALQQYCRVMTTSCPGPDTVISWVRRRDLHILTIATITYTADRRFSCSQSEDNSIWSLNLKSAVTQDSGEYECQISTEPKISKLFRLRVTEAASKIQSGPSIYVKEGSVLNLTCIFTGHAEPARHVLWFRGDTCLNTDGRVRGGINIISDKVSGWSNLILSNTSPEDTGIYRCEPNNALKDEVQVNIIKDGDLAAGGLTGSGSDSILLRIDHLKMIVIMIVMMLR